MKKSDTSVNGYDTQCGNGDLQQQTVTGRIAGPAVEEVLVPPETERICVDVDAPRIIEVVAIRNGRATGDPRHLKITGKHRLALL